MAVRTKQLQSSLMFLQNCNFQRFETQPANLNKMQHKFTIARRKDERPIKFKAEYHALEIPTILHKSQEDMHLGMAEEHTVAFQS